MSKIVLITGFSTAGKSTLLKELKNQVRSIDSDEEVARVLGCAHIYEVFMKHGPERSIKLIENAENDLLSSISNEKGQKILIAAGPFLMLRERWEHFFKTHVPFIIHLVIQGEDVYNGLLRRRNDQKEKLDQNNPYFGSWDNNVTTSLSNGIYVDLPKETALANIRTHLVGATAKYIEFENVKLDSIALRKDDNLKEEAVKLIKSKLDI